MKKVCLSNQNIGQICLNVYFLFYSFVYFSSPCRDWISWPFFFLHFFFIRAFSPLPFFRKLFKKFLRGDFLQPPYFKTCSAEKQLIFNYRKLSFEGAVSRLSSSFRLGQTVSGAPAREARAAEHHG